MTIYYTKQGRRYIPAANGRPWHHDHDVITVGQSRLETVVASGERTYQYGVAPEYAGIAAALAMLRHELTHQIRLMAIGQPVNPWREYTPDQRALIEEFQARMADAGGLFPSNWTVQSPSDIATAICNLLAERSMHASNAEQSRPDSEASRLMAICQTAHDRLLRGDQDAELLAILEAAWKDRPTGCTTP